MIGKLTMTMTQILEFASVIAGFIAGLTLYLSGRGYPNPSWKRQTEPEIQHRRKQRILRRIGLPCLFASVIFVSIAMYGRT